MLKQVTINNIYNFKNELTLDFINDGSQGLNKQYGEDFISNFSLIYGKNNVGKSNLFKLISEVKEYVLDGQVKFKPYSPQQSFFTSLFEVIIENIDGEIRYGFEVNLETLVIYDEWLYNRKNKDKSENLLYSRLEKYFDPIFTESEVKTMSSLKSNLLYLTYFNNVNHKYKIINQVTRFFKQITLVKCDHLSRDLSKNDLKKLVKVSKDKNLIKVLNVFLEAADVDIIKLEVQRLNKSEEEILKSIKQIENCEISAVEKNHKLLQLIDENKKIVAQILSKSVLNNTFDAIDKNLLVSFKHKSKAQFEYAHLSSGTKKILSIVLSLIDSIKSDKILFFDEIENNLHIELIHLTLSFMRSVVSLSPNLQIFISTHRDEMLDYSFISSENKIFLKIDPNNFNITVEYLSQYKLKDYHLASKRYALDAFNTNPNTSKEYKLNMLLESLFGGDRVE